MQTKKKLAVLIGIVFTAVGISQIFFTSVSAAPNDVVINEIMYHASSDDTLDDYIELYNNTGSAIDLEGWCFTDGISFCFTAGMSIGANDYVVVAKDAAQALTTYSVTAIGEYSGNLSNGGETVTLEDDTFAVVNSVTYDDAPPWPLTPDEGGPSLELVNPLGDTTDPLNWRASIGGPTPDAENSVYNLSTPVISDVTDPNGVAASTAVTITADIDGTGITDVNLNYKVNFAADVTVTMSDDGASGDGAAGDGVYGAEIPGQAIGTLVRFSVEAINGDGTTTSPRYDDTQNYHGYYIADPSVTSNAEVLEWFIDEADYNAMYANSPNTPYYPAVFAYGDEVFDNSEVRLKGEYSLTFPKKSYKMKLPKGHDVSFDWDNNDSTTLIDEFHINGDYSSEGIARQPMAWWIAKQAGLPVPDLAISRLQRNGDFEGLYVLMDKYEDEWRETHGYDNGPFYEDYNEIVDGTDSFTPFINWQNDMRLDRKDPERRNHILDQNNIPAMFNYMAVHGLALSHDHNMFSNTFTYQNSETERWEFLLWDMDLLFNSLEKSVSPYDTVFYMDSADRFATTAIYDQPDLRQAYLRRVRTLADKLYTNNEALTYFQNINTLHTDDSAADVAKWPDGGGITRASITQDERMLRKNRNQIFALLKLPWNGGLPPAQTNAEKQQVSIAQVVNSANNANEFIRISNGADTAVDISDWVVEGIDYTLPAGSVVPANGSIYLLRDDLGYKASHAPVLVAGQYSTDLSAVPGTNLVLKTDADVEIDTYDY